MIVALESLFHAALDTELARHSRYLSGLAVVQIRVDGRLTPRTDSVRKMLEAIRQTDTAWCSTDEVAILSVLMPCADQRAAETLVLRCRDLAHGSVNVQSRLTSLTRRRTDRTGLYMHLNAVDFS